MATTTIATAASAPAGTTTGANYCFLLAKFAPTWLHAANPIVQCSVIFQ